MHTICNRLTPDVFHTVKSNNLLAVKSTHRGTGGFTKQAQSYIPVRITQRLKHLPTQCRPSTLKVVHKPIPWNLPTIINTNVRSLNGKTDELQAICDIKKVEIAVVTETFISDQKPLEQYQLDGYHKPPIVCCRKDQSRGGVACYIQENLPYKWWQDLTEPDVESLWLTIRPKRLPKSVSIIIIGAIYHPPTANNNTMVHHIYTALETILQKHPVPI